MKPSRSPAASGSVGLEAELRERVRGEVRFDHVSRLLYRNDASIYEIMPVGVVVPEDAADMVAAMTVAARHGAPVLPRGAGTSLGGQAVGEAVILDCSKRMNRILSLDADRQEVRVQPGVVLEQLNSYLRPHRLQFGPDVATSNRATLGGMMGNNSCGSHSLVHGKTIDHVVSQSVVLSDATEAVLQEVSEEEWERRAGAAGVEGAAYRTVARVVEENREEIDLRFPRIMRRVGGYNLDAFARHGSRNLAHLTVGSEGTLALVSEAVLRVVPLPAATALLVAHFDDLIAALKAVPLCLEFEPAAVELTDRIILDLRKQNAGLACSSGFLRGDPEAILVIEFQGDSSLVVEKKVDELERRLRGGGHGYAWVPVIPPPAQREVWKVRNEGLGLLMGMKGDAKPTGFVEDTAVSPDRLAEYISRFRRILEEHRCAEGSFYGHASVGCLHIRPLLNLKSGADVGRMRAIAEATADLVLEFGGALSAEHGDGLVRSEFQEKMFGPRLYAAFQEVKGAFDPRWLLNPGKIVRAPPMTENLRYGEGYQTIQLHTQFDFSADGGFARSVELCSGVGACRKKGDGTMCPSYRATLEEEHSTRGRANILRAALTGRLPPGDEQDSAVMQALDLCLECKACKSECPSNVDMARMKYEFLSHHHARHGTPLRSRFFAGVAAQSRRASRYASAANALMASTPIRWGMDRFLGIDRRRPLPRLARKTFLDWFRRRSPSAPPGAAGPVMLMADTFTNYYEPMIGQAAVELLESLGYRVEVPDLRCCGRPMISKGLLQEARRIGQHNIERVIARVREGVPLLGCEPSCVSAYRDDLVDLVGGSAASQVAASTHMIEQFVAQRHSTFGGPDVEPLPRRSLFHGHCHQKALFGTEASLTALRLVPGMDVEEIPAGCCGMAGSFGYEKEHYELSLQIGELGLLPRVRSAPVDTVIVASGTSCRQQIRDAAGREALHPVQVMAAAAKQADTDESRPNRREA